MKKKVKLMSIAICALLLAICLMTEENISSNPSSSNMTSNYEQLNRGPENRYLCDQKTSQGKSYLNQNNHCYWSGNGDNLDNTLTSPVIEVPTFWLEFYHQYDIESGDEGYIDYKVDQETTWHRLASFSGNVPQWHKSVYHFNLSCQNLQFKFTYRTGTEAHGEGWHVDNILLLGDGGYHHDVESPPYWDMIGWAIVEKTGPSPLGTTGHENWYTYVGDGSVDVNIANGNLIFTDTYLSIRSRIDWLDFDFGRWPCLFQEIPFSGTYNCQCDNDSSLGLGWTNNFNVYLQEAPDGTIMLYDGDGSVHEFTKIGETYVSPPGVHSTLIRNEDGTFMLLHKYGMQCNFNNNGKRTSIVDTNGNKLTLIYDYNKRLTTVSDDVGNAINLEYDGNDKIIRVSDSAGRQVTYGYTGSSLLSKVTDQMGYSTVYTYNENSILESITNSNGKKTIFTYRIH